MSQECDREGVFQAEITDYGLKDQESGAVAIPIRALLTGIWNQEAQAFEPWAEYEMYASGDMYVVKKDGSLNQGQVQSLTRNAGWDGTFTSIVDHTWQPTPVSVVVKADEYKGVTRYRIAFINAYDAVPGQFGSIDPEKAKALQARFGGELRALTGNSKRNTDKPNGKPPTPPARGANAALQEAGAKKGDDIPF